MTWKSKQRPISSTWIYERIEGNYKSILDIGCIIETKQPSDLTLALLKDVHRVFGISLRDCDYLHSGFAYQKRNILDASIKNDLFDVIIASQVMGFVGKRYENQNETANGDFQLLMKIRGWLKENGRFFCCVTLAEEPVILKNNKKQVYSLSTIFNLFKNTGLNCLEFKTFPGANQTRKEIPTAQEGVFMLGGK